MKKALTVVLLLVVLLVVGGVCAMYLGYTVNNGNTNLNNVSVGGINVEKMTAPAGKPDPASPSPSPLWAVSALRLTLFAPALC